MKKIVSMLLLLIIVTTASQAKVRFGLRGGYNVTTLSFSQKDWSADNRNGFYVGPTLKIGLPLSFGLDISAIYDQRTVNATKDEGYNHSEITDKRKAISIPANLRFSFGLGEKCNIFAFAGPQFDFNLNKDINETNEKWTWSKSTYSVNVGVGVTLLTHVEIKANYNIPCNDSFTIKNAYLDAVDGIKCKTGAWQIGAAIYF